MAEEGKGTKGKKDSTDENPKEGAEPQEGAEAKLEFDTLQTVLIYNPHEKGCLVEKEAIDGKHTNQVVCLRYLTPENRKKAYVDMYAYKSIPPADGTYVVLEFELSGKVFFAHSPQKESDKFKLHLCLREGDFDLKYPKDPEDITTTDDPRVFLMQPSQLGSRDLLFSSCHEESKCAVITMFNKANAPAELRAKGNGPELESQYFKLSLPRLSRAKGVKGNFLEVEPYIIDLKPPGAATEHRDEHVPARRCL
ncbi:uncharacterized protein LOC144906704 [Branchiostoma floridae x Branchiostoma belcheri]